MPRRLPVFLVGGFFGSGKTSLLHHMVSEHQGGHLAILVEEPGAFSPDQKALRGLCGAARRLYDTVLSIPSGDEAMQLAWLSGTLRVLAEAGHYEQVWIELSGATNPTWLARHFGVLPGQAETLVPSAILQQVVMVIDTLDFYEQVVLPARKCQPGDWVDFLHAQVEGASLLVVNKCDVADEAMRSEVTRMLRLINPDALMIQTDYGEVPAEVWARPGTLQQVGLAVEKRLRLNSKGYSKDLVTPQAPLVSQDFRVWRPFHPERLWTWFESDHSGLIRVKGLIWLATRHLTVGGLSRTRQMNSCGAAGIWWDALPREEWPEETERLKAMQETWREPYGDRRQELTLIGNASAMEAIQAKLQACLLTAEEEKLSFLEWQKWPDPFPVWNLEG